MKIDFTVEESLRHELEIAREDIARFKTKVERLEMELVYGLRLVRAMVKSSVNRSQFVVYKDALEDVDGTVLHTEDDMDGNTLLWITSSA